MPEGFIPAHGGYQNLLSYRRAEIVFDATVRFCRRFLDRRDRTVDQMVQAARSGKQNIVEGSMASGTSKETELKLTNVARASMEELLTDFRDILRLNGIKEWDRNSPEVERLRELIRTPGADYDTFKTGLEHPDLAVAPIPSSGLSRLRTISWTSRSATWKRRSWKKEGCANA